MCWCISTHKLKLLVVVLTLIVAIDGELKASINATLLLYYSDTKFWGYLIARCLLGLLLTLWALLGFFVLFHDSVYGVAIYSSGICVITAFDVGCAYWEYLFISEGFPKFLNDDHNRQRIYKLSNDKTTLEQGIAEVVMVFLICVQIVVNIAGWWLAMRLRRHQAEEEQYERDKIYLEQIRQRS